MDMNKTLENLRVNYRHASLDVKDIHPNPIEQFNQWLQEAINSRCDEPNAFVLSTVASGRPRSRVVLLKGLNNDEFIFYTNYLSHKGHELQNNPYASMNFLWLPLQRQVRIEGKIQKVSSELSNDYFQKRPRGNQLGAIASPQSQTIKDRESLESLFNDAEKKFAQTSTLERPPHWGGYSITPDYFEFWQGRESRMHDRISYKKENDQWTVSRLAP
jgi:pyridoxamine 5'-phosphate oxidase